MRGVSGAILILSSVFAAMAALADVPTATPTSAPAPTMSFKASAAEVTTADRFTMSLDVNAPISSAFDGYICYVAPDGSLYSAVKSRGTGAGTSITFYPGLHRFVASHLPINDVPAHLRLIDLTIPQNLMRGSYRFIAACAPPGSMAPFLTGEATVTARWYFERDAGIPMRDGVILRANVWRQAPSGRFPALIFRTPYSKDEGDPDNERTFQHAVDRGYAVIVQDVRGRYQSEGLYTPYVNEGKDGYDTIEWAAVQPWSDGNVGTFGLSYPGAVQWLAAVESPPHLKAMVPAMCFSTMREFIYFGGVFEVAWANWVYVDMTPDTRVRLGLPGATTVDEAKAEWNALGGADVFQGWLPLLTMPYLMDTAPYYYDWIRHQPYESYWDWGNLETKYDRVRAAVLNISGWYDEAYGTQGATTNYLGLLAARAGWKDPRTKLLIGPWIHGVDATASECSGDRCFGPAAVIDYDNVVLSWLDHYVRGISNWVASAKPVNVFVMGDNRWRRGDEWPLKATRRTSVYCGGDRSLSLRVPQGEGSSSFTADPANPVRDDYGTNFGATDLRWLAQRSDVLTFETDPLPADIEVTGPITAEIYLSSDAHDCDIYTILLDVAPDGTAYNLMGPGCEVLRASYRDQTTERKLLSAGEVVKLTLDRMRNGNMFLKGHRLRLCLTASWYPIYSRNLQTGELEGASSVMQPAAITIHHSAQYPSRLLLPIIPHN
ncbi:MAG: CocE/NonD family hydrolase [Candidatus Aureabacteria bacterium]|nr:CocE/NonD family hydrolase [Candidatus Auribacterota bacterium]